jgi:hypothetical protein
MDIESGQFEDAPEDLIVTIQEESNATSKAIPAQTTATLTANSLIYDLDHDASEDESDVSMDQENREDDFFEQDLDVVNGQDWETLAGGKSHFF